MQVARRHTLAPPARAFHLGIANILVAESANPVGKRRVAKRLRTTAAYPRVRP